MGIITISRQFGAGGKTIGRIVAEKLGYQLIDDEIIENVAKLAKVPLKWAQAIENEAGGTLLKFISGLKPSRKSLVDRCMEDRCGYLDEASESTSTRTQGPDDGGLFFHKGASASMPSPKTR